MKLKNGLMALAMMVGLFGNSLLIQPVKADAFNKVCEEGGITDEYVRKQAGCDETKQVPEVTVKLFKFFIGIVGLVGLITVIVAGQRFVTANGDVGYVKQARQMLIYGIVGIVIAMMAFAIVNFVTGGVMR